MTWNEGNVANLDRILNSPEMSSDITKKICKNGRVWGHNNCYDKPDYIKKQREAKLGPKHPKWKGDKSLLRIRKYKSQNDYLFSKEILEKMIKIGRRNKKKRNNPMYGKHHSKITKAKMSEKKKFIFIGKGNPNWQGGISFEIYPKDFNKQLKDKIRKRDNFVCQKCFRQQKDLNDRRSKPYKLIVHHIDLNKNNNAQRNLISLCRECHLKAHYEKTIGGDLYGRI